MHVDQSSQVTSGVLSIANLLNILYRRRALIFVTTALGLAAGIAYGIIVKPLYRGTVQVRPGIVAFTPEGGPVREAALEDIVGWFDKRLYWRDFQTDEGFSFMRVAPAIDADFVPSPNFVQGGDVITLTNLSQNPGLARDILDRAVDSYNRQARLDSLGSTLHLTQRGAQIRLEKLQQEFTRLDSERERTDLQIVEFKRELTMVDLARHEIELDLQRLVEENAWHVRAARSYRADAETLRTHLDAAEKVLAVTLQTEYSTGGGVVSGLGSEPISEVLLQTASREQAGRVGDLLATVALQSRLAVESAVRADSLEARVKVNDLEMKRLRLKADVELTKQQSDIEQKIRDQQIVLERDIPREQMLLQADQRGERARLGLLSPLQRVGPTAVSEKPVRPRRPRAAAILTCLGLAGGIALALVWEYLENNRAVITAPRRPL